MKVGKFLLFLLAIFVVLIGYVLITGPVDNTSRTSTKSNNGMSNRYNTDSQYRQNVDYVSGVYGISPQEAEGTVNKLINGR